MWSNRVNLYWTPQTALHLSLLHYPPSLLSPFSLLCLPLLLFHMILATLYSGESSPRRHARVWQRRLPCWKLTQSQGFHFGGVKDELRGAAESGWQEEPFNRCVFRVALSQPLSGAIDEGGSLWLRQGLKAPVREAWEPSSHQTLLHIKQAGRAALCSPTVSRVERCFDRDTTCRREEITRCSSGRNTSLHYIMLPDSKPLGFLQVCKTHTHTHRHSSV